MTHADIEERADADPVSKLPRVNRLDFNDIRVCFRQGLADFLRAPLFGLFFGGVFACGGILIIQSLYIWEKGWLIYPIMVGFPLIGPFAAVGLYEVSRRLQQGRSLDWSEVLTVSRAQKSREIPWMGFVMLFIFGSGCIRSVSGWRSCLARNHYPLGTNCRGPV